MGTGNQKNQSYQSFPWNVLWLLNRFCIGHILVFFSGHGSNDHGDLSNLLWLATRFVSSERQLPSGMSLTEVTHIECLGFSQNIAKARFVEDVWWFVAFAFILFSCVTSYRSGKLRRLRVLPWQKAWSLCSLWFTGAKSISFCRMARYANVWAEDLGKTRWRVPTG